MLRLIQIALVSIIAFIWHSAEADIGLKCIATSNLPVVDGKSDDDIWKNIEPISTRDSVAGIDYEIQCAYGKTQVFMLVKFPDADENRQHKRLSWKADEARYIVDTQREDTLVLKWNMEPFITDISISADEVYKADVWYWKSVRTDHAGFADDKLHIYSDQPLTKGSRVLSKLGRRFYLRRKSDDGRSAYKSRSPAGFEEQHLTGYEFREPQGSRADVRAKGQWSNGWWTIEFARDLKTGNADDVQLVTSRRYQFGVSRYEIAGRKPNPKLQVPLYGSGEIGENIFLVFDQN